MNAHDPKPVEVDLAAMPHDHDHHEAPLTKNIETCGNSGCVFNAGTGRCSAVYGRCYGYFPPAASKAPS